MEENKIKALVVIEILGSPKEHVEDTLKVVIEKLREEKNIKLLKETSYKAEEVKKLWSAFADLEVEVLDIIDLMGLCFDYMPSSVEIVEPNKLNIKTKDIDGMLNDLLAKLHKYDLAVKKIRMENIILKKKQPE